MPDHNGSGQNPYMRPTNAQQLIRQPQTRRATEPVSLYTPNEPDGNEAVYAARAAAARQQQPYRQPAAAAPVQQAMEQAALQAHAARQPAPIRPDAVFYQQATGVQQPQTQPIPQAARQTNQPHRLPMEQTGYGQPRQTAPTGTVADQAEIYRQAAAAKYAAQTVHAAGQTAQPYRQPQQTAQPYDHHPGVYTAHQAPATPSISRRTDAAVLADPMLAEEASQTAAPGRRRSRMVMRQERENDTSVQRIPAMPEAAPMAEAAPRTAALQPDVPASEESAPETLREKAEQAKAELKQTLQQPSQPAPQEPSGGAEPMPDPMPEIPAPPKLDTAALQPEGFRDPLEGLVWAGSDSSDEDEDAELDDCMDTSRMPIPAPVSTLDVPKVKRSNRLLMALIVLMLLLAAGGFLWLSGTGEKLINGAVGLIQTITDPKTPTGPMTVSPEAAALPATLTITLTTGNDITDIRLLRDDDQLLTGQITAAAEGEEIHWTCSVLFLEAYDGFIRAELLGPDGQWRLGSESRHVQVN